MRNYPHVMREATPRIKNLLYDIHFLKISKNEENARLEAEITKMKEELDQDKVETTKA